jgi:hypothetical protein
MFYVPKIRHTPVGEPPVVVRHAETEGRCRRNAPTMMKGYPVVFAEDWCGEHKRGSNPVRDKKEAEDV